MATYLNIPLRALAELFKDGEVNDTGKLFDFEGYDYTKINELLSKIP